MHETQSSGTRHLGSDPDGAPILADDVDRFGTSFPVR